MANDSHRQNTFHFKKFSLSDAVGAMKIGTDAVILGAWAPLGRNAKVLDIGTGTAVIALLLASRGAKDVTAIEIDKAAASEAISNVNASPWRNNVTVICDNALTHNWNNQQFDLIVSNPPFFREAIHSPHPARAVARHDDTLPIDSLFSLAAKLISPQGVFAIVFPADREDEIIGIATMHRLYPKNKMYVRHSPNHAPKRILWSFTKTLSQCDISYLSIKTEQGAFSEQYISLTGDFYLNL